MKNNFRIRDYFVLFTGMMTGIFLIKYISYKIRYGSSSNQLSNNVNITSYENNRNSANINRNNDNTVRLNNDINSNLKQSSELSFLNNIDLKDIKDDKKK